MEIRLKSWFRMGTLTVVVGLAAVAMADCPATYSPTFCYEQKNCPWIQSSEPCRCTRCGWNFIAVGTGVPGKKALMTELANNNCIWHVCNYINGNPICDESTPPGGMYSVPQTLVTQAAECVG